jgi:hypothetical protein
MHRLRELLRRTRDDRPPPLLRPNQLRLDVVRAERLRREARQASQLPSEEQRARRPPPAPTPPMARPQPRQHAALGSRSRLRQALLLKEVLDPPLALRESPPR